MVSSMFPLCFPYVFPALWFLYVFPALCLPIIPLCLPYFTTRTPEGIAPKILPGLHGGLPEGHGKPCGQHHLRAAGGTRAEGGHGAWIFAGHGVGGSPNFWVQGFLFLFFWGWGKTREMFVKLGAPHPGKGDIGAWRSGRKTPGRFLKKSF